MALLLLFPLSALRIGLLHGVASILRYGHLCRALAGTLLWGSMDVPILLALCFAFLPATAFVVLLDVAGLAVAVPIMLMAVRLAHVLALRLLFLVLWHSSCSWAMLSMAALLQLASSGVLRASVPSGP